MTLKAFKYLSSIIVILVSFIFIDVSNEASAAQRSSYSEDTVSLWNDWSKRVEYVDTSLSYTEDYTKGFGYSFNWYQSVFDIRNIVTDYVYGSQAVTYLRDSSGSEIHDSGLYDQRNTNYTQQGIIFDKKTNNGGYVFNAPFYTDHTHTVFLTSNYSPNYIRYDASIYYY